MAQARKTQAKKASPGKPKKKVVFDDLATQADDQGSVGHFVVVTKGEHEGRYGALLEVDDGTAIVRTRDDLSERLVVDYEDLEPSEPGHR